MKKISALVIGLFASVSVFAQSGELPTTTIKDLKTGKKIAFNQTIEKGKVTVVSVWAIWCIPCKKEINNIRKKMADWKKEADFNYMAISIDESRNEGLARSHMQSQGWDFPSYLDPNSDLKRSLNFQNIPFTFIIDKNGKVAFNHTGYEEGGENEIFAKVKELVAQ